MFERLDLDNLEREGGDSMRIRVRIDVKKTPETRNFH